MMVDHLEIPYVDFVSKKKKGFGVNMLLLYITVVSNVHSVVVRLNYFVCWS